MDRNDQSQRACCRGAAARGDESTTGTRARMMVQLGEHSAMEAAEITRDITHVASIKGSSPTPPRPRENISRELLEFEPATTLEL